MPKTYLKCKKWRSLITSSTTKHQRNPNGIEQQRAPDSSYEVVPQIKGKNTFSDFHGTYPLKPNTHLSAWLFFPVIWVIVTFFYEVLPAQPTYPALLKIPVTFYDFHSDWSNPEFEIYPIDDALRTGMVAPTLDNEMKPTLGTVPFFNRMISNWFRSWIPGNHLIYNYYGESGQRDNSRFDRYQAFSPGLTDIDHDTSFKNIVIHDTLDFSYVAGSKGMYEFNSDAFFPLDNRGFGAEGQSHNYSFTMELHWTFTMVPGLTFKFSGDDDVWAFIDKQLVMDIGGIHNPRDGQFNIDNIPDLVVNHQYSFDLFYAERHVTGSNIRISTNIMTPSSAVKIYDNAAPPSQTNQPVTLIDSIKPGVPVPVYGHIFDTMGVWFPEFDDQITWRVEAAGTVLLSLTQGAVTTLTADTSLAGSQFVLIAQFTNPSDPAHQVVEARITLSVVALPPEKPNDPDPPLLPIEDHVDIVPDSAAAYAKEVAFPSLKFTTDTQYAIVYAVIRDVEGNFIRFAGEAVWHSSNPQNITPSPHYGYETSLTKQITADISSTEIVASEPGLAPDTLLVTIQAREQSAVIPNPFAPGKVDITTVLPVSIIENYTAVLDAAPSNYVTFAIVEAPEPLMVFEKNNTDPRFDSYADIQLYDAVGNLIRTDLKLIAGLENLTYAVAWEGKNRNRRIVGSGAYLMVIKAKKKNGQPYILHHKVAVVNKRD